MAIDTASAPFGEAVENICCSTNFSCDCQLSCELKSLKHDNDGVTILTHALLKQASAKFQEASLIKEPVFESEHRLDSERRIMLDIDVLDEEKRDDDHINYSPKPLEMNGSDGQGRVIVHSTIPYGFAIVKSDKFEGKRIIATRHIAKDSLAYVGYALIMDLSASGHGHTLRVFSEDRELGQRRLLEEFENSDTHSVDDYALGSKDVGTNKRQVFGWDGFMNHSCEPNMYFAKLHRSSTEMCYQAIALRDIGPDEEVTCDYALFDYNCNGHEIEACACESLTCRGQMLGFSGLSMQEKVRMLNIVEDEIKAKFIEDENVEIFKSMLPEGIAIVEENVNERCLVATQRFEAGQMLFTNRVQAVSKHDLQKKTFILEVDGGRHILLSSEQHFIHREQYAEMLGFDSFMDHSCSPNTHQEYVDIESYIVRAKRTIFPGDKITCDYMALQNNALGNLGKNVGTESFECNCGSSNCIKVLVC